MPLTPFHFGPGVLIKSVSPKYFSLSAFIVTQIIIDFEVLWNAYWGHPRLHTLLHSYLGSVLAMGLGAVFIFGFIYIANKFFYKKYSYNIRAHFIGLIIGAWSHVFLDSMMHGDLFPFYPLSESQPLLGRVSLFDLHAFCVLSFFIGGLIYASYKLFIFQRNRRIHLS